MKITVHANAVQWQREYLPRFVDGFTAHGHRVHHVMEDDADPDAINVIFANNSWKKTEAQCIRRGIPLITVGRCFFGDRFKMVAIGWDGFNAAADFCLDDEMPSDRWDKHGFIIPLHGGNPDGYVLVCGEFREMDQWYHTMREILAGEDVRFRAHPFKNGQTVPGWQNARPVGQDSITDLFPDTRAVITYDSIAGCDAVLNGVPSIAWGENSMARDVSFHSWRSFLAQKGEFYILQWAKRLSYCQWSHDEIRSGEFWEHLKKGMDSRVGKPIKRDIFRGGSNVGTKLRRNP